MGESAGKTFIVAANAAVVDFLKFADTKAGAAIAGASALMAAGGTVALGLVPLWATASCAARATAIGTGAALLVVVLLGVFYALKALSPRLDEARSSLSSFPDVARIDFHEYLDRLRVMNDDRVLDEYAAHTWTLSRLASAKFAAIATSLRWLGVGLLLTVALGVQLLVAAASQRPGG